tara:strand:+ start:712 stop:1314 length:603 start_codon:yes stop_codon:yes gene_type:complete
MINITKKQIKDAFVSDVNNIGEYVYNNQDWYQEDSQRIRYILATLELSPGDSYAEKKQLKLGQEDNRFYGCIEFGDNGTYTIKDEALLSELIVMTDYQLADYIADNEYDWLGDDYDHANEYLFGIMNHWQDKIEYDTEDYDNCDCMTVTTRSREWNVDPESGYKSENAHEVGYNILMDYFDHLPEDMRTEAHKRLEAIGI